MKTEYEKCLAGEFFIGRHDSKIKEMILNARRLLRQLNEVDYDSVEEKQQILKKLLGHVGEGVHIDIDFHCELGRGCVIFCGRLVQG